VIDSRTQAADVFSHNLDVSLAADLADDRIGGDRQMVGVPIRCFGPCRLAALALAPLPQSFPAVWQKTLPPQNDGMLHP
jgi:hypothetical protein